MCEFIPSIRREWESNRVGKKDDSKKIIFTIQF